MVKLPKVFHDRISAGTPETTTVGDHISVFHAARKAFINAETSDKLRRALRKQARKARHYYEMNDIVYYKGNIDDKWKGPAKRIGQDGPVVFLRHGEFLIKANSNHIQAENLHDEASSTMDSANNKKSTIQSEKDESIDNNEFTVTTNPVVNSQPPTDQQDTPSAEDSTTEKNQHSNVETNNDLNIEQPNVDSASIIDPTKFQKGQLVIFNLDKDYKVTIILTINDYNLNYKVEIMSRATKATGSNREWYNFIYHHPETEKFK